MTILFSVAVGRNTVCAAKRCLNAIEYSPDAILIVNCHIDIDRSLFSNIVGDSLNKTIFINPIARSQNKSPNVLESHLRNYKYACEANFVFDYIYFLSDQDMFFRKGLYDFIKNYDVGFLMCSHFLKPAQYKEIGFAEGEYVNQRLEPFWTEGLLPNPLIERLISEQIEGEFYRRNLFQKIYDYIENMPVHYTKIVNIEYAEVTFGTLYINLFQKEFPVFLPVSTIYRVNDIVQREKDLFNIITGQREVHSMPVTGAYPSFHMHTYGIKRVKYHEDWDVKVKNMIVYSKQYLASININNDYL